MKYVIIILSMLFNTGCGTIKNPNSQSLSSKIEQPKPESGLAGTWQITSMADHKLPKNKEATFFFKSITDKNNWAPEANWQIGLSIGCNSIGTVSYIGTNPATPKKVFYISMTEMFCGEESMKLEEELKTKFYKVTHYQLENELLLLKDAEEKIIFNLKRKTVN